MGILKQLILVINILFSLSTLANRHEHFASWPTASSIIEGYKEAYGNKIGNLRIEDILLISKGSDFVSEDEIIAQAFKELFTEEEVNKLKKTYNITSNTDSEKAQNKILGQAIRNKSLDSVIQTIHEKKNTYYNKNNDAHTERLKRFFKFNHDGPQGKNAYMTLEKIRIKLLTDLKQNKKSQRYRKFLLSSFGKTIEKIPLVNREFIGVSVPGELFDDDLSYLKKLFERNGTDIDFYYSYPRSFLTKASDKDNSFEKRVQILKQSLKEGWGDGVDITGSINEDHAKPGLSELRRSEMQNRLHTLIKTLDEKENTVLRLHAFEAANKGGFYEEMYKTIEQMASGEIKTKGKPPVISIGHLAEISDEDIDHLKKIKETARAQKIPFNIVFDANYMSNEKLQGTDPKKIAAVVAKLQDAGFEVGLGSDGTGILGKKSSVPWQANALFNEGTTESRILELTDNSAKAPVCDISYMENLLGAFR